MAMNFWAIAVKYDEDVFYDFEKEEDTFHLSESCMLPTKAMADQIIEDELCDQYTSVSVTIETIEKSGSWSYTRGTVPEWDEEYGDDE